MKSIFDPFIENKMSFTGLDPAYISKIQEIVYESAGVGSKIASPHHTRYIVNETEIKKYLLNRPRQ